MTGEVVAGPVRPTTGPVADINPGARQRYLELGRPGIHRGRKPGLFVADDGVNGKEVWVSDGRPGGSTQMAGQT